MKKKNKEKPKHNLEKEREELLKLMKKSIPEDIQQKIDHAVSYTSHPKQPNVTISDIGTCDAV